MRKFKKILSVVLSVCMIASLISGLTVSVSAEGTSVQIVSFVRGDDTGLRSSELLEARVSGYDGKLSDLTFEWKNELWTYLYVYNSSNMYNIKDTIGEHEIGSYSSYKKQGYAWAAVYGANLNMLSLLGSISVKVTDKNGNVIGEDSYSGFKSPNLPADLQETTVGLFEGESMSIKDMLGRSAIVHIDCRECFVNEATVTSGSENISMTQNGDEYVVKGENPGKATISMTVKKGNCKFHQNKQGTISNTVHCKVTPFKIILNASAEGYLIGVSAVCVTDFCTEGGNFYGFITCKHGNSSVLYAGFYYFVVAEYFFYLIGQGIGCDICIVGSITHQKASYGSADDISLITFLVKCAQNVSCVFAQCSQNPTSF